MPSPAVDVTGIHRVLLQALAREPPCQICNLEQRLNIEYDEASTNIVMTISCHQLTVRRGFTTIEIRSSVAGQTLLTEARGMVSLLNNHTGQVALDRAAADMRELLRSMRNQPIGLTGFPISSDRQPITTIFRNEILGQPVPPRQRNLGFVTRTDQGEYVWKCPRCNITTTGSNQSRSVAARDNHVCADLTTRTTETIDTRSDLEIRGSNLDLDNTLHKSADDKLDDETRQRYALLELD